MRWEDCMGCVSFPLERKRIRSYYIISMPRVNHIGNAKSLNSWKKTIKEWTNMMK